MRHNRETTVKLTTVLIFTLTLGACAIKPVPVTDRGNLAKSVMQRDIDAQNLALEMHTYSSKEQVTGGGGYGVGGGGCGCN